MENGNFTKVLPFRENDSILLGLQTRKAKALANYLFFLMNSAKVISFFRRESNWSLYVSTVLSAV